MAEARDRYVAVVTGSVKAICLRVIGVPVVMRAVWMTAARVVDARGRSRHGRGP